MPIPTIDQFKALVRKSGAVAPERLEQVLSGFNPAPNEKDPTRALVRHLIARKLLTPWQSEQLLRGKSQLCLGNYRLLGRLGAGGMSTVFAAEHVTMRRQVAIKVLPKDHTSRPQALDRFLREAQVISQCNHPNVVQAYDVDHVSGVFFIVLERVEGRDLEKMVLVDGPLTADRAADFVRQAAEGLAHIHSLGVVHRDVKPSNFLLDLTGNIKLTDLGVALLTLDENGSHTGKQTTLGTTEYMAPEQAMDSHAVDARADLYSLGCTLYFLLTGATPFPAHTMAEALLKHLKHTAKPISAHREEMGLPEVPDDLVAICDKLMAKKPADRFQTAEDLASELISWQARRSVSISETWNNVSSETPTEAWTPRSGDSSQGPRRKWDTDETVETKSKHVADATMTIPPTLADAETTETLRPNDSTIRRDGDSQQFDAKEAASTLCEPIGATLAETALEEEPAGEFVLKTAPAATPAPASVTAESRGPVQISKPLLGMLVAGAAAGLVLLMFGVLWATGLLSGFSSDGRPGKLNGKKATSDATPADLDAEESGLVSPQYLDGQTPVLHTVLGRVGRALVADGSAALVFAPQAAYDPDKLTVECWVRVQQPLAAGQTAWLVAKNDNEHVAGHYSISLQGDRLVALLNTTGGAPLRLTNDSAVAPGSWRHAALVDDGKHAKFYVDGRLAASSPVAAPRQKTNGALAIGVLPNRAAPPASGVLIDEVGLYRKAFSEEEVKFHAERPDWAATQHKTSEPIAAWSFDALRLENPSFEADGRGWNLRDGARVERERKLAHNGEKFVRLPEGHNGVELNLRGLTPGVTYTAVAWCRSGSAGDQVNIGVKEYGGRDLSVPVASTEWTATAIPFTVTNDQGFAKFFAWKPGGGEALIDDVSVLVGLPDAASLNSTLKAAVGPALDASELSYAAGLDPALLVDPARRALWHLCGKHNAVENIQRDGFNARRESGSDVTDWPAEAARRHGWTDGQALYFCVETPPNVAGVLRLIFADGDKKGRRQRVNVDGRDVGEVANFSSPQQMMVAIDPEMTADGRVTIACFATGTGEAVVSEIEFYAPEQIGN